MFRDGFPDSLVADLPDVLQHPLDGAVLFDQLQCRLGAHAGHPGDVVRRVTHEAEEFGHPVGTDAEPFLDTGGIVGLVLHRVDHDDTVRDELHEILVARDDDDVYAFALESAGQGSDHVVGLDAPDLEKGDAVGSHQVLDHAELGFQLVGHGLSVGLVVFEGLVAERGTLGVEDDGDVLGFSVAEELGEHVVEAEDGVCRDPPRVGEPLDGEKSPVDVVAAVDEIEGRLLLFGHRRFLPIGVGRNARLQATGYRLKKQLSRFRKPCGLRLVALITRRWR